MSLSQEFDHLGYQQPEEKNAEIENLQASGVKKWELAKTAQSSINGTCTHDLAFKRTGPGRFVLRLLLDKQMQVSQQDLLKVWIRNDI